MNKRHVGVFPEARSPAEVQEIESIILNTEQCNLDTTKLRLETAPEVLEFFLSIFEKRQFSNRALTNHLLRQSALLLRSIRAGK